MTQNADDKIRARYPHTPPERSDFPTGEAFAEALQRFYQGQAELTDTFFGAIPFPALSTLANGTIVFANTLAQQLLGLTPSDFTRHRATEFLFDASGISIGLEIGTRISEGEIIRSEAVYVKRPDGRCELRMLTVAPAFAPGTRTLVRAIGFFLDPTPSELENQSLQSLNRRLVQEIESVRKTAERNRVMAYTDEMTGLPNTRAFWEKFRGSVEEERRNGGSVAVFFFDPDDFKSMNDRYGHRVGDNLVRAVGGRLRIVTERYGGFVARLGGDEFCAFFAGLDEDHYRLIAEDFVTNLRFLFEARRKDSGEKITFPVSVSIGGSFHADGIIFEPGELYNEADEAMYESKESGRGIAKTKPCVLRKPFSRALEASFKP